jgi:uncharacterized protein YozE (UPF0346 family)
MNRTFYQFALSYRGGKKSDDKAVFAEGMFKDLSFPKEETRYDPLSRYIEEKADEEMRPIVFDELYNIYIDRVNPDNQ